jgi:dipeptidyl aminopeptidase/acylaminoacyl peptidase
MTERRAHPADRPEARWAVPQWPFISADGRLGGFVRSTIPSPGPGRDRPAEDENNGVFVGPLDGVPQRLPCGPPSAPPVPDLAGRRLLLSHHLAHQLEDATRISIARLDRPSAVEPLGEVPGSVQQLAWDEPADRVFALVAEPGADTASLTSGRRSPRRAAEPEVDEGPVGTQQVWSIALASGRSTRLGPTGACVWEVAPAPDGTLVCVCSSQPGEDAWYFSFIARFDPRTGVLRRLYSPRWQVASVAVDPGSGRVAFAEGWASDRGLVAGVVIVIGPDGEVERRIEDLPTDVTWLGWDRRGRLFFAGWHDLGVCWGHLDHNGTRRVHQEAAAVLGSAWRPSLALSADGEVALACRSDETTPPEVVTMTDDGGYRPWVTAADGPVPELSVIEGAWPGAGGEEIHGILLLPGAELARTGNGGALVVLVHGGPTIAYHHAFDPAHANRLLAEGFSVLLPNPRGSVGRGPAFARGNHGDPGGAELEDVLSGARWAAQSGLVPPGEPAVMGSSYGGYLSALAATSRAGEIAAAVAGAAISDLASCRHTCNNAPFYDLIMGGLPTDERVRRLCVARSPVYQAAGPVAPTLILHGEDDRCVPVSQAHELFNALRAAGGEVELATYEREGHQVREPDHLADYWARAVRWLSAHRSGAGPGAPARP